MAQRCMIAMALINMPRVLIADDATNGLDGTVHSKQRTLDTLKVLNHFLMHLC